MGYTGFYWRQLTRHPKPPPASIDLAGQTAILTGSNVGIGLETARQFVQHRCTKVILAVRNQEAGEKARADIERVNTDNKSQIEVWNLDYDDIASIGSFVKKAHALDRLDFVCLNSGLMYKQFKKSKIGHEMTLQVNYLSTALLSLLLLPVLQQSAQKTGKPSRLTMTTSEVYEWTAFKQRTAPDLFAKLDDPASFSIDHYPVSKLLVVLWTRQLASKADAAQVIINCVNPGTCWSSLHRDVDNAGLRFFKQTCAWTPAEGAYCLFDALVDHADNSHGKYLSWQEITPFSKFVLSLEGQEYQGKLWDWTIQDFKENAPDVQLPF